MTQQGLARLNHGFTVAAQAARRAAVSMDALDAALRELQARPPKHHNPEPMFGLRTRVGWDNHSTLKSR